MPRVWVIGLTQTISALPISACFAVDQTPLRMTKVLRTDTYIRIGQCDAHIAISVFTTKGWAPAKHQRAQRTFLDVCKGFAKEPWMGAPRKWKDYCSTKPLPNQLCTQAASENVIFAPSDVRVWKSLVQCSDQRVDPIIGDVGKRTSEDRDL
jgi:hypothetical protein